MRPSLGSKLRRHSGLTYDTIGSFSEKRDYGVNTLERDMIGNDFSRSCF